MAMRTFTLTYIVVLSSYLILDFIWLGLVSQQSYQAAIGHLMRDEIPVWPWVTFYCVYAFAVTKLVVMPARSAGIKSIFTNGCILGVAAYGAYNLTNYAIIDTWPMWITLKDWFWGTFVTGVISVCGALFLRFKTE